MQLLLDGVNLGFVNYGDARAEVCATFETRPPNCPRIGFSANLNLADLGIAKGNHTLAAQIIDESGRVTVIPDAPVNFVAQSGALELPKAVLTSPAPNEHVSGTITISGYAWAPSGNIAHVNVVVDNNDRGEIPYGLPRPEACAQLPDVRACPRIGFETQFNTKVLSNGPHTMYILVVDDKGGVATAPPMGFFGISIVVEN